MCLVCKFVFMLLTAAEDNCINEYNPSAKGWSDLPMALQRQLFLRDVCKVISKHRSVKDALHDWFSLIDDRSAFTSTWATFLQATFETHSAQSPGALRQLEHVTWFLEFFLVCNPVH
jgi:hypothetical protein